VLICLIKVMRLKILASNSGKCKEVITKEEEGSSTDSRLLYAGRAWSWTSGSSS
jgi:hypothetical protein